MTRRLSAMDMEELGYFIYMDKMEKKQNEDRQNPYDDDADEDDE